MYEKQCNDKGWHFVPAAFEVFGLFGKKNKELLAILDKTCEDVVAPARLVKKMWMQACSTALARREEPERILMFTTEREHNHHLGMESAPTPQSSNVQLVPTPPLSLAKAAAHSESSPLAKPIHTWAPISDRGPPLPPFCVGFPPSLPCWGGSFAFFRLPGLRTLRVCVLVSPFVVLFFVFLS